MDFVSNITPNQKTNPYTVYPPTHNNSDTDPDAHESASDDDESPHLSPRFVEPVKIDPIVSFHYNIILFRKMIEELTQVEQNIKKRIETLDIYKKGNKPTNQQFKNDRTRMRERLDECLKEVYKHEEPKTSQQDTVANTKTVSRTSLWVKLMNLEVASKNLLELRKRRKDYKEKYKIEVACAQRTRSSPA